MSITVAESWFSGESLSEGQGNPSRASDARYIIRGTSHRELARNALAAYLPPMRDGLILVNYDVRQIGPTQFEGAAAWGLPPRSPATEDNPYAVGSFSTSGGTSHITQSRETLGYGLSGDSAPDFHGAINVAGDSVEGVDIITPKLEFALQRTRDVDLVTTDYVKMLVNVTGTTNLYPFLQFERGELLFLGADGTRNSKGEYDLSFRFAAAPNSYGIVIPNRTGGQFEVPLKRGWQYIWQAYSAVEDTEAKKIVQRALGVYVETVYPESDFAQLGLE